MKVHGTTKAISDTTMPTACFYWYLSIARAPHVISDITMRQNLSFLVLLCI